jgi:carbonic anhydrase/acetyltransferase-like protein (isoleucine patch superfamily)
MVRVDASSSVVTWLGPPRPVFPYPEEAQALCDLVFGSPGDWAPTGDVGVVAGRHVAWNRAMLRAFQEAATSLPARLCVTRSPMTEHTAPLGSAAPTADGRARAYDLFLVGEGIRGGVSPGDALAHLRRDASPVVVTLGCDVHATRSPGYGKPPHVVEVPRAAAWVAHVERWPHLLWLGQGASFARRAEVLGEDEARGPANVVAPGARVHRTAHVEGSVLGEGAEVEAHATVVGSILGRGVRVADHSAIHDSVVGEGCTTLADTLLRRVVAMPGSTLSNMDLCEVLLGRGVFTTSGVIFFRGEVGRTARVGQAAAEEEDTGKAELGGAVGHGCVLGARAILAPGRALPGGTVVVMRPEEGVALVAAGVAPGEPLAWDDGKLVGVRERWPGCRVDELDE